MCKADREKPSYCITAYEEMSERPTSSIMFPICSFFLSISSCLAADRSSASHLWASDEPSSDHIRHGEAISARTFLVMVCFPQ